MIIKLRVFTVISHMYLSFENTNDVGCGGLVNCIAHSQIGSEKFDCAPGASKIGEVAMFHRDHIRMLDVCEHE